MGSWDSTAKLVLPSCQREKFGLSGCSGGNDNLVVIKSLRIDNKSLTRIMGVLNVSSESFYKGSVKTSKSDIIFYLVSRCLLEKAYLEQVYDCFMQRSEVA